MNFLFQVMVLPIGDRSTEFLDSDALILGTDGLWDILDNEQV